MVVDFISDEANLARLDRLKEINGLLGDPRKMKSPSDADALIAEDVPMYWATGGMHAPESGPPEMLMELAYRLAASEEPIPGISSGALAEKIAAYGHRDVTHVARRQDVPAALAPKLRDGDLVLTLGAGDITQVGPDLLALLERTK